MIKYSKYVILFIILFLAIFACNKEEESVDVITDSTTEVRSGRILPVLYYESASSFKIHNQPLIQTAYNVDSIESIEMKRIGSEQIHMHDPVKKVSYRATDYEMIVNLYSGSVLMVGWYKDTVSYFTFIPTHNIAPKAKNKLVITTDLRVKTKYYNGDKDDIDYRYSTQVKIDSLISYKGFDDYIILKHK